MAGSGNNFIPQFQIWDVTGTILIYIFPAVNSTNMPQSTTSSVEIQNLRSSEAIIIDGGLDQPFNGEIQFTLSGNGYVEVTNAIEDLESKILPKVPYLLRIEKSSLVGDYFEIKVKRLRSFQYATSLRLRIQPVTATFRANSW